MKLYRNILFIFMISALLASQVFAKDCPSPQALINAVSTKKPNAIYQVKDRYQPIWWVNFESADYDVWYFSISNISATNEVEALAKAEKALSTLSGNPKPILTKTGTKCVYQISFGYHAVVKSIEKIIG